MKRKVMIVDDNPDLVHLVKKILEKTSEDYQVIGVESGRECFEVLNTGEVPDIVLLDIMMPEMSGWDVLAKLRNEPAWEKIPVVFLTAKDDDASKGLGTLTSEGYITKPFDISYLDKIIKKIFEPGERHE
jgi:putative two-component system response regulator